MNTSYLRSLSAGELERLKNKLMNYVRSSDNEERMARQIDMCWVQKVQQENASRRESRD